MVAGMSLDIRNNMALVGWTFMSVWMGGVGLMTYAYLRDGGFHQFNPLIEVVIVLMFWLFGLAGCSQFFSMPRIRITISDGLATVTERWLLRRRVETVPVATLVANVVQRRDSEGDPYYRCEVTLPSGRMVVARESHDPAVAEAALARFTATT